MPTATFSRRSTRRRSAFAVALALCLNLPLPAAWSGTKSAPKAASTAGGVVSAPDYPEFAVKGRCRWVDSKVAGGFDDDAGGASDAVRILVDDRGTTIDIVRSRGIGSAEISLARGRWSPCTRIYMRKFDMLESLTIGYAGRCHLTSLSQAPLARLGYVRQDGACIEIPDARSPYRLPMHRAADGIVIDLPAKMLNRKTRTLTVNWIDAYRD